MRDVHSDHESSCCTRAGLQPGLQERRSRSQRVGEIERLQGSIGSSTVMSVRPTTTRKFEARILAVMRQGRLTRTAA